jgi:hypothetical protein
VNEINTYVVLARIGYIHFLSSSRMGSSFFSTAKKRKQKTPPLMKKLLKINPFH